jgi:hypothetical protein
MKKRFIIIIALIISLLIPVHSAFAYGGGGGGGDGGGGDISSDRGDLNEAPSGFEPSTTSLDATLTTGGTEELDDIFNQLPPEVQEALNDLYISLGGICIGIATAGTSVIVQILIGGSYSGATTALTNIGKDESQQSSIVWAVIQGGVISLVPGGPIVQDGVNRTVNHLKPQAPAQQQAQSGSGEVTITNIEDALQALQQSPEITIDPAFQPSSLESVGPSQ